MHDEVVMDHQFVKQRFNGAGGAKQPNMVLGLPSSITCSLTHDVR
jgi:hypothetical protein